MRVAQHHLPRKIPLVTRPELLAQSFTPDAIRHACRAGRLFRIHDGVYSAIPPELLGAEALELAALLAVGDDALRSHGTAALRQELIGAPPERIHVTSPRCLVAPHGVELHRCTTLRPDDIATGRLTSVPRTLLDLATTYDPRPLLDALAEAEFHHAITPRDILATLRRGHPGSGRLRAALEQHVPGYGEARSRLERRFRELLIAHGIPLPLRNQRIGPHLVTACGRRRGRSSSSTAASTGASISAPSTPGATCTCGSSGTCRCATAGARCATGRRRWPPTCARWW